MTPDCGASFQRRATRDGFTLIELSMVVVLLSIFTFIVVRSLDNLLPQHRLEAGSREVAGTIRTARDQAILTSKKSGIVLDIDNSNFWIILHPQDGSDALIDAAEDKLARNSLSTHALPRGITFTAVQAVGGDYQDTGQVVVEISPLGAFSDLIVYLTNDDEQEMTLLVSGMTGLTDFFNGHIEYEDLVASYEPI